MATSEAAFPPAGAKEPPIRKPPTKSRTKTRTTTTNTMSRPAAGPATITRSDNLSEARATIIRMRDEASERARPAVKAGAAPIRVMANMVKTLEAELRARHIPAELIATEVVNRTIGDVDLRRVSPDDDGPEFVSLADDMGLALPGEVIGGRTSTGESYYWLHNRMLDFERRLLARGFDVRMYDLPAIGNPLLREMLAARFERHWGYAIPAAQIHLSLGALDGLDKFFRGLSAAQKQKGIERTAVMFPAPSFNVPEWQVKSLGLRLHRLYTRPEDHFKVTPAMLQGALDDADDIRAFYLTVSNNPTAFAYSPAELEALCDVILASDRDVLLVTDLAYIGTGKPDEDRARMAAFNRPGIFERTVFVNSFSKTHSLTGDRCGWVGFGSPELATECGPGWINTVASLPAEWQLRYMAYIQLFDERPEIDARIRALYAHRRTRLRCQLQQLNKRYNLFACVNLDDGGTVYNWSQLRLGEDVFSLFGKTGIAGVPGGGFGYSDDFVRLSVGCIPVPASV